jgi:hypothetical protein
MDKDSKTSRQRYSPAGHRQIQGAHGGQDQASNDVIEEFSKWLEAGEESIFSLEAEKNQVHPTNCLKPWPELKTSRKKEFFDDL